MICVSELAVNLDLDILEDEATHDPHCWQLRNIMMSVLRLYINLDQRPTGGCSDTMIHIDGNVRLW